METSHHPEVADAEHDYQEPVNRGPYLVVGDELIPVEILGSDGQGELVMNPADPHDLRSNGWFSPHVIVPGTL